MKTIRPQKKGSFRARVVRLLRTNRGFEEPSSDREKIVHASLGDDYYNYRKEIETAWSEAERKKAEALAHVRRFIY